MDSLNVTLNETLSSAVSFLSNMSVLNTSTGMSEEIRAEIVGCVVGFVLFIVLSSVCLYPLLHGSGSPLQRDVACGSDQPYKKVAEEGHPPFARYCPQNISTQSTFARLRRTI